MQIKTILNFLESWASPSLQESYDNSGLLIGDQHDDVSSTLLTLDVTEKVMDEAIKQHHNLIIAHHPIIFKGIKSIGKQHWIDKCIRKAIQHDIAIYALHTNLDNIYTGVNRKISDMLGLRNVEVLQPKKQTLSKLTFYVPTKDCSRVLQALFEIGVGRIGNYEECSFTVEGQGSFRPNQVANPTIGQSSKTEFVREQRVEVLVPAHLQRKAIQRLKEEHPYEEVAYYLEVVLNDNQEVGAGMIGSLPMPMSLEVFTGHVKKCMNLQVLKATSTAKETVSCVAVSGGSGSFLLSSAISRGADVFISADFKYHEFFEANNQITIMDIGHYESEVFTKNLLLDVLKKRFNKFAFVLSKVDTNPVKYL